MNFNKSFDISPEMRNILPNANIKKPTRNFLMENIKNLRQMQNQMESARKSAEESKKLKKPKKRTPFTATKVNPGWIKYNPSAQNNEISERNVENGTPNTYENFTSPKQFVSQGTEYISGVQTSPQRKSTEDETLIDHSTHLSTYITKAKDISNQNLTNDTSNVATNLKKDAINKMLKDNGINFVELNRRMDYRRRIPKDKPDPHGIPPSYQLGELPRYLKEKKKTDSQSPVRTERNEQKFDTNLIDHEQEQLPGHILLTDEERLEHLKLMKKCYEDLLVQFNQLPVRSDSLKSKQKRAELEKQLDNLEKSMKLFSKEKLYIKL